MRKVGIERATTETEIELSIDLDGDVKRNKICSGVGFLDHMLTLFARYAGIEISLNCKGDTYIDDHHSVEDIGIVLGLAVKEALGDKKGIKRFASLHQPMDEALVLVAVDISGRGGLYTDISFPSEKIGTFDTELVEEFMRAFAINAGITLHIREIAGSNSHHISEAAFKGVGRALREALSVDERFKDDIPSTKGMV